MLVEAEDGRATLGAGIKRGVVYGESDRTASAPRKDPVHPGEILATIYTAFGIDPHTLVNNHLNQPRELVQSEPLPHSEGVGADRAPVHVAEADPFQRVGDPAAPRGPRAGYAEKICRPLPAIKRRSGTFNQCVRRMSQGWARRP